MKRKERQKNPLGALSVTKHFVQYSHWKNTLQYTLVKNPTNVNGVKKLLTGKWSLSSTWEMFIQKTASEFQCSICHQGFYNKAGLTLHLNRHAGIKPHHCNDCSMTFCSKAELNSHSKIHSEEKNYKCQECGKRFRRHGNLREHLNRHNGHKRYKCKVCNKPKFHFFAYILHEELIIS